MVSSAAGTPALEYFSACVCLLLDTLPGALLGTPFLDWFEYAYVIVSLHACLLFVFSCLLACLLACLLVGLLAFLLACVLASLLALAGTAALSSLYVSLVVCLFVSFLLN